MNGTGREIQAGHRSGWPRAAGTLGGRHHSGQRWGWPGRASFLRRTARCSPTRTNVAAGDKAWEGQPSPTGRTGRGHGWPGNDIDGGPWPVISVDTRRGASAAAVGPTAPGAQSIGLPGLRAGQPGRRAACARGHIRVFVSGIERTLPRPARPPDQRASLGGHTAPAAARFLGRAGGFNGEGRLVGQINTNRLGEGFYLAIPGRRGAARPGRGRWGRAIESAVPPRAGASRSPPAHVGPAVLRRAVRACPTGTGLLVREWSPRTARQPGRAWPEAT